MNEIEARVCIENASKENYLEKINYMHKKDDVVSELRWGNHWIKPPMVTVIIPAYKRPELFKRALKSALNQKDFKDYQILIADDTCDGEGVNDNEEIVRSFQDNRIIYYKNKKNLAWYNWNRLVELSKSEWICMLHDDDILHPKHLYYMAKAVSENINITMLACQKVFLREGENALKIAFEDENEIKVKYRSYAEWIFQYGTFMLGAFINREKAILLGGFNGEIITLDFHFVEKMAYYYNYFEINLPTYGYGLTANESLKSDMWEKMLISEYYICKSVVRKRSKLCRKFLDKLVEFSMAKHVETMSKAYYNVFGVEMDVTRFCKWLSIDYLIKDSYYYLACRKIYYIITEKWTVKYEIKKKKL